MRSCAVVGCSNSTNRLKRWKSSLCPVHKTTYGSEQCDCDPPFRLFSFPGAIKDPEHRKQWVEIIKRKDPHTGQLWAPKQESRVCSKHFVDGRPTEANPNPTLHLFQMDIVELPSGSEDDGELPDNSDEIRQKRTVKAATVPNTAKTTAALKDRKAKEQESKRISPRKTADMGRSKGKQQQQQKVASKKSRTRSSSSARDEIELLMECFEEALSPAQMKAIKQAQADHEKANDQIKEIRAGNTLVPSSQPNTFTIVPPTPKPQPAPPPAPPPPPQTFPQPEPRSLPMPTLRGVMKAQPLQPRPQAQPVQTPPQKTAQNGKNLSDLRAQQLTPRAPVPQPSIPQKPSPDIILISETPAPSKPVIPTSPQLIPALPQQMYKMVPPGSQLTPLSQGQWVIRPLVTVSPQQMVATVPPSLQKSPASTAKVPAVQPAFANGVCGPNQMVLQSWGSGERRTTETVQSLGPSKRGIAHTVYSLGSSERRATESRESRQEHNLVGRIRETESSLHSSNISGGKAACINRTCCTYSSMKKLRMVLASHFSDRADPEMSLKQTNVICCRKQSDLLLKLIRNKVNKCRRLFSNAEKQSPNYLNAELRQIQCETSEIVLRITDTYQISDLEDIQIKTELKSVSKECSELKQPCSSQINGSFEESAKNKKVFVKPNYSETRGLSLLLQNAESRPVCDKSCTITENSFVLCSDELHKNKSRTMESQPARLKYFISFLRTEQNNRTIVKHDDKCYSQLDKRSAIDIEIPSDYIEDMGFSKESSKDQHVTSTAEGIRNEAAYQNSGFVVNIKSNDISKGLTGKILCTKVKSLINSAQSVITGYDLSTKFKEYYAESLEALGSDAEVTKSVGMLQACMTDGYTVSAKDKHVENHENILFEEPFNLQFSDKSFDVRTEIRGKDNTIMAGHKDISQIENVKYKSFEKIAQVIESYSQSKPGLKSNFWMKRFDQFHKQREIEVWTARSVLGKSDRTTENSQGSNRNTSSDPVLSQVSNPEIMELNVADNSNMSVSSEISSGDVPLHGTNVGAFPQNTQNTNAANGSSLIDTSVDIGIPQRSVRFSQSFHIPSFGDSLSFDSDEDLNSQDAYQFPSTNESSNSVPSQIKECKNQPASHVSAVVDEDSNFGFNVNENEPNDRLLLAKSYREDIEEPAENLAQSISLRIKTVETAKDSEERKDGKAESDKDNALVDYLTTGSAKKTIKSTATALTEAAKINDDNTHKRNRERINLGVDQNSPGSLESQSVKDTFVKNFKEKDSKQKEAGKTKEFNIDESTSVDETNSFTETKTVSDTRIQSHVNVSDISAVLESNVAGTIACNMRNLKDKANYSRESTDKDKNVKKNITTVIENIKSLKSKAEDKNQKYGSRSSCNKKSMSDTAANENESSGSDSEDRLMIDFNYDSDHGNCFSSGDDEDGFNGRSRLRSSALESIASQNSGILASPGIGSQCVAVSSFSSTCQDSEPTKQMNEQSCEIVSNNTCDGNVKLDSPQVQNSTGESSEEEKKSPFEDHSYFRNKLSSLLGKEIGTEKVEEVTDSQAEWSPVVGKTLAFEQSEVQPFDGRNLIVYKALSEQQKKDIFDSYMKHGIDETCKTHNIPVENLREILKEYFESRLHEVENLIGSKPASVSSDEGKAEAAQITVKSTNKMQQRPLTGADNIVRSTKSKRENTVIQVAEILPTVLPKKANIATKSNEQNASSQRVSSDSMSELKCFEIKDDDYITDKLGRRLYSYDFKKRVVNLADRFGDINVGNQVNLDKKTVQKWRNSCMKFDQNKVLKHDKTEKGPDEVKNTEDKKESKVKRFRYSESLKIKLVHMAKMYGVSNVVKQYGVKKTTLQLWNQILCDRKLASYELTDKDLLELVDGAEYAKQQSVKKTVVPSLPHNINRVVIDDDDNPSRELHSSQHDVHGSLNEKVTGNSSQIEKPVIPDISSSDDNTSTENTFPSAIPVILEVPSSSASLQSTSDRQQTVTSLLRKALSKIPPEKQAVGQPSAAYIHGSNVVFRYDLPKASKDGTSVSSLVTKSSISCTNESLRTSLMPDVASSIPELNPLLVSYPDASSVNISAKSVVKVANAVPAKKPISVSGSTMNVDNLQRTAASESTTDINHTPAVKILSVQHIHPGQPLLSQPDLHHVRSASILPAPPALHKYGRISTETRDVSEHENVQERDKNAVSVAQNTSTTVFSDGFQTAIAQAPQVYSHPASLQTQVSFTSKSCTLSNPPSFTPVVCVQSGMSVVTMQASNTTPVAVCSYMATSNYSPVVTSSSILTNDKQSDTAISEPVVYTQSQSSISTSQIKQEPQNDNEYSQALGYSQPNSASGPVNIQSIPAKVPVFVNTIQSSNQGNASVTFSQSTYRNSDLSSKQYPAVYVFNRDGRITNVSDAGIGKQTPSLMTYPLPKVPVATATGHTVLTDSVKGGKQTSVLLKSGGKTIYATVVAATQASIESNPGLRDVRKNHSTLTTIPARVDFQSEFKKQIGMKNDDKEANKGQQEINQKVHSEIGITSETKQTSQAEAQSPSAVAKKLQEFENSINTSQVSIDLLYQMQLLKQFKRQKHLPKTESHATMNRQQQSFESRINTLIKNVSGRLKKHLKKTEHTNSISSVSHKVKDDTGTTEKKTSETDSGSPQKSASPRDEYFAGKSYFRFSHGLKLKLGVKANKEKTSAASLAKRYHVSEKSIAKWRTLFADSTLADTTLSKKQQEELLAHKQWVQERKELGKLKVNEDKDFQIYIDNPESADGLVASKADDGDVSIIEGPESVEVHQLNQNGMKNRIIQGSANDTSSLETSKEDAVTKPNTQQVLMKVHSDSAVVKSNIERQKELEREITSVQRKILKKNTARKSTTQGRMVSKVIKQRSYDDDKSENSRSVENEGSVLKPLKYSFSDTGFTSLEERKQKRKETKRVPSPVFDVPLYIEAQDPEITNDERSDIRKTWTSVFKKRDKHKGIFETSGSWPENDFSHVTSLQTSESCEDSTDSQDVICLDDTVHISEHENRSCLGTSLSAKNKSIKEVSELGIEPSSSSMISKSVKDKNVYIYTKEGNLYPLAGDPKYSLEFKLKIVKEAHESGCENAAKWYQLSVEDVRKWHDTMENDKQLQFRLAVIKCAKMYGMKQAERLYSVSEQKISDWLDQECEDTLTLNEHSGIFEDKTKDHWEGLQFERFKNGDVSILRPKFDTKSMADGSSREESPVGLDITSNNRTRTRMGGNSVSFASGQNFSKAREVHSSSNKEFEKEYLADVEGDIGAMPRIVKQKCKRNEKNDSELEIASTWKQVQDYVQQPDKIKEKKFSAEFKAKIIKLCTQKGQKTVAKEYKIPYNKISRWRLKAKSESEVLKAAELQKTLTDSSLVIKINLKDEPKVMSHVNQAIEPEKSEFSDKFKKEVVLYSRKHGFIAAAREYKIGTPRILSWLRQLRSFSFDATENQTIENKIEVTPVKDFQKCKPKKVKSPRHSSGYIETSTSPKGNKSGRRSSCHSENFHQDYIISKSSVGKDSALKITLSPRRKSPAPSKASSEEGSEIDDFEEVATWSADEAEKDKSDVIEVSDDDVIEIKDTDEKHISKLDGINSECIVINDDKDVEADTDSKDIELKHSLPSERTRETVSDRKVLHSSSSDIESNFNGSVPESQESQVKPVSGNLYDLLETDESTSATVKPPDEFPVNYKEHQPETELDVGLLPLSDSSLIDNEVQSTERETSKLESGTQLETGKQKTSFGGKKNLENDTESTESLKEYQKKDLSVVLQDCRVKDKGIATATSAETVKMEVPEVPYEETLMFKVFSAGMDDFFTGSFEVSKPLSEIGNTDENPEKSEKPAVRKRKMTADVEIMGNLDEKYREYLFGPEPFPEDDEFINEGNSSQPDWVESPESKDEANETEEEAHKKIMLPGDLQENIGSNEAKMEFDKMDHKEVSVGHESESFDKIKQTDDTDENLAKAEPEQKNSEGGFKNLFTNFNVCSDVAVPVEKNIQKTDETSREPQTRNVFDFMIPVSGMETGNDEMGPKKAEFEYKDIQNEEKKAIESHFPNKDIKLEKGSNFEAVNKSKSSRESSPFNLFGSLMKNIKLPSSLSLKNLCDENMPEQKSESKYQSEGVCAEAQCSEESESKLKNDSDMKEQTKDKGNRNLFDFLSPVSNKPEKQELHSPEIPVSSPMPGLFERLKVSKETDTSKEENSSKLSQPPKASFKFLSLPVNFGNIAKLGIAKLKEGKSAAKDMHLLNETKDTTQQLNIESKDEIMKTGTLSVSTVTESNSKTPDIQLMAAEESTEVCTFEDQTTKSDFKSSNSAKQVESNSAELTNDMAANEISREEKVDNIEVTQKGTMGNENNGDVLDNGDDELYMSFAPQKVILILDISKKHGIEFASTSFGLPPKVIVNWIIEKDRKHRKVASSYTLEEKLTAVNQCEHKKIEDVSCLHKIDINVLKSWKEEVAWLLESPGVLDVLQKWSRVQARTSISLEDDGRTNSEMTKKDEEMRKSVDQGVETAAAVLEKEECSSKESSNTTVTSQLEKLPDILSFAKTTHPKDYSVEQKAVVVLLLDKYGVTEVNKKLGISTRTLWGWKHRSKAARDYILTHSGHRSPKKKLPQNSEENSDKPVSDVTLSLRLATDVTLTKETKSLTDQVTENIETRSVTRQANEKLQEARKLMAQPAIGNSPLKGYRLISPTKIPSILQDVRKLPTKDFTLDQRVAIVKLVDLYGVRTVHKQFRIPAGSIWNWQHSKAVMALARPEGGVEKAKKNLDFDETEAAKSKPDTIETIMERVKTNLKSLNHLQLNSHQKADAVCLVNYYGIDIVFKALKIIPRGTLWNWCHNKYVGRIVEKKMQLLQEADLRKNSAEKENSEKKDSHRNDLSENIEQSVDRKDFTQKWLRLCHQDCSGRKRKSSGGSSVTESSLSKDKKTRNELNDEEFDYGNFSDNSDYSEHSDNHLYEEIDIDLGESLNSSAGMLTRSSSLTKVNTTPSIVSSVSIHSGDYEEAVSDEEQSRSCRSRVNSQGQRRKSHSANRQTKKLKVEQSEASSADIGCAEDLQDEIVEVPTLEVDDVKFDKDNRTFVSFKVTGTKNVYLSTGEQVTSKLVEGTPGSGLKKASEPATPNSSPQAKKKTPPGREKEPPGEINSSGNWVPLDEYYYGTMDGDQNYEEEKGEFRFKCWYCSKMLYNNVRAMQHIQGHIDSSKQQNIDLSDLTQCKQCYKQFDTPFEMQTHMEKVHLSNKVLMCRICEKDQPTPRDLTQHMRQNHHPCEMPYVCQLCNFRSSMYNDVVDHFKKKHDSSQHLLCLYCLRTFLVKFVSQGWGQTQTYYGHLLKHQSKSTTKKCVICRLTFFNSQDVKLHRKTHHIAHHKGVLGIKDGKYQQQEQVMIKLPPGQVASSKQKVVKSLNVPASCKVLDIGGVVLPGAVSTSKCVECKTSMGSTDHYKKFINCSMCRFATSCSIAYANHMMGFHSGQMSSLNLNIPWERPMPQPMYCSCGFSSKFGNKIANHLAFCSKQTCFKTSQGSPPSSAEKSKATEKGDENLLDVLGLMKRRSLTTRGKRAAVKDESGSRTREKSEEKTEPADSKKAKIEKEAEPVDNKKAKIEKEVKDEKKKPGPKKKPKMGPKKRMAQIKAARARRGEKEEAEEEMDNVDTEVTEKNETEGAETDISKEDEKISDENISKDEGSDDKSKVADVITDKEISKDESSEGADSDAIDKATIEESKKDTGIETVKEEKSKDMESAGIRTEEQDSSKEPRKDAAGDVIEKSDEPKISEDEEKKEESMEVSEAQADDTENKDIGNKAKPDKESEIAEADKDDQISDEKEVEGIVDDSVQETDADDEAEAKDKEMIDQTETDIEKLKSVQENMETEMTDTDTGAKGVSATDDNLESVEDMADSSARGDVESSKVDESMEVDQEEEGEEDIKDQSHDLNEEPENDDTPKETEELSEKIVPSEEEKTKTAELEESKEADKSETEESEEIVSADTEEKADDQSAEKDSEKQVSASASEDKVESDKEVQDSAGGTEAELEETKEEAERGGDANDPKAERSELEPPAEQTQGDNKSGQLEESAETSQETPKESATVGEGDSKNKDTQQSSSAGRQSSHERSQEREHGSHRDSGSHGDSRHSRDHDRHQENRSYDNRHRSDDRHRHDNRPHGDRHGYDERYRHDDRSRGGYQGGRSYDRNWDNRDRSYDRDHRGGDYRRDDRGQQGYNRGPQDRNQDYNRNQHGYNRGGGYRGNFRGGYNQNYRGGYRGSYY